MSTTKCTKGKKNLPRASKAKAIGYRPPDTGQGQGHTAAEHYYIMYVYVCTRMRVYVHCVPCRALAVPCRLGLAVPCFSFALCPALRLWSAAAKTSAKTSASPVQAQCEPSASHPFLCLLCTFPVLFAITRPFCPLVAPFRPLWARDSLHYILFSAKRAFWI